ncbi:MAG: RNA polymerase sigma-54 factor, partial [Spirochaetia bacterium]|nr:RNA polymerase sigma-54 factor [Spirochaetia bacterium]
LNPAVERTYEVPDDEKQGHDSYRYLLRQNHNDQITSVVQEKSLYQHLLEQASIVFDTERLEVAEKIIGNLDDKGFFPSVPEELIENYDLDMIQGIIKKIQEFDPVGICAKNARECLEIQLLSAKKEHSLSYLILTEYYDLLIHQKFKELAKKLLVDPEEIKKEIKRNLSPLDPFPGLRYGKNLNQTIVPDIVIERSGGCWAIKINDKLIPKFQIQQHFIDRYEQFNSEEKKYLDKNIAAASWIINAVSKRKTTLEKIVGYIIKKQSIFFNLERKELLPMTISEIAKELEMSESTIARAVNQKYVQCALGCFSLKSFFSSSTSKTSSLQSSYSAKQLLIEILKNENKDHPFSDTELVRKLKDHGIPCARRTVTKYREALCIPPAFRRKI